VSEDRLSLWARVEDHLRVALAAVELPPADRRQVEEFVDHNELGLAFQWMVAALADEGTSVSTDTRAHLAAAAADMDLSEDPDWRRLEGGNDGLSP
jgi:hypothetical protein